MPPNELAGSAIETASQPQSLDDLLYELQSEVRGAFAQGRRGVAVELLALHPELIRWPKRAYELLRVEYSLLAAIDSNLDAAAFAGEFTWFPQMHAKEFVAELEKRECVDWIERNGVPWPEPGDRVAGFEFIGLLGRGAAARVYLAQEPALGGRLVAIKVSPQETSEAKTLGKLVHPNIVPVHSVADGPSRLTLVCMPFHGRATLGDVWRRLFRAPTEASPDEPSPEVANRGESPAARLVSPPRRGQAILDAVNELNRADECGEGAAPDPLLAKRTYVDAVVHLAAQMAGALAYTHAQGICHGDIKPANVLLTPEGRPMLLDFNLANRTGCLETDLGGTLLYMAPEKLSGAATASRVANDPRSDLFSLGVIVYQMLSGALPFGRLPDFASSEFLARWMWQRQRTRPSPLSELNGDVDPALARLVERCLAFDAADRPQTARELAAEFRRHLTRRPRARRWVRAHRWLVTAATVAMVLGLGAAAHRAVNRPSYAQQVAERASAAYARGDFGAAERDFTASLDHGGKTWQTLYFRGRARQRLGNLALALDDYKAAKLLHPTREIRARIADCSCRQNDFASAIGPFGAAIEQGLEQAEIYNNLGVCFIYKPDLKEAGACFDEAIELAPELSTPYYNQATLAWKMAFDNQRALSQDELDGIDGAVALGLSSPDVLAFAAQMYAYRAEGDAGRRRKALDYLAQAVRQGANIEQFKQHPVLGALFDELRARADYHELVAAGSKRSPVPTSRLLELPDDLDP